MEDLSLTRFTVKGVTLLGNGSYRSGVTFAFSERTGGVSAGRYASLNLGARTGDEPEHVLKNTLMLLEAIECADAMDRLVHPHQVHSDDIVVVRAQDVEKLGRVREVCEQGADAVVCTACDVPVLLVYADCAPVVLVAEGGFAVIHSGRKGTVLRIAAKAADALARETATSPMDIEAFLGPRIGGDDYEVGEDLANAFEQDFDATVRVPGKPANIDIAAAIKLALIETGLRSENILDCGISTYSENDRFFSHRRGDLGRHAAVAIMRGKGEEHV